MKPLHADEIDAVLDGTMPEPRATEIRRRVAGDPELRARYGPLFELELFGAAADDDCAATRDQSDSQRAKRTVRWLWIAGPLVAAASLLLLVTSGDSNSKHATPTEDHIATAGTTRETPGTTRETPDIARETRAPTPRNPASQHAASHRASLLVSASVDSVTNGPRGTVRETWNRREDGIWEGVRVEEDRSNSTRRVARLVVAAETPTLRESGK